jgi:cyclin D1/2/4
MGPSYDCAASVLLCAEDNAAILGLDDDDDCSWAAAVTPPRPAFAAGGGGADGFSMGYPVQTDDIIAALVEREEEHMPTEGYPEMLRRRLAGLDLAAVRRDAIDWIWKVSCPAPLSAPIGFVADSGVARCDGHGFE